jgi:methyl-accepting chemotaxis protein PixJ
MSTTPPETQPTSANNAQVSRSPKVGALRWNSLGTRLFLSVISGAVVGLGGMGFVFYNVLEQQAKTEIQASLETEVNSIESKLTPVQQSLEDLGAMTQLLKRQGNQNPEDYKTLLLEFFLKRPKLGMANALFQIPNDDLTKLKLFAPYYYADQNLPDQPGKRLAAPNDDAFYFDLTEDQYASKEYYTVPIAAGKDTWSEPYEWSKITMTTLNHPFFDQQGKVQGFVTMDVNLTVLSKEISANVFRDQGFFVVLSEKGNVVSYPPDAKQVRESHEKVPQLKEVWSQVQKNPSGIIRSGGNYWAYQRVPSTNWLMLAAVPQGVVVGPVLFITVGSTVAVGLLLAGVVVWFVNNLNRRLQPILDECQKLAETDAETQAEIQNQDEVGRLSLSFFNLLQQLAANEDRIREEAARTVAVESSLKQSAEEESEALQSEVGHILDVVSAAEDGDLTVQASVSDRATGLVADTLNRLIEQLAQVLSQVLGTAQQVSAGSSNLEQLAKTVAVNAEQQAAEVAQVLKLTEQVEQSAQQSGEQVTVANQALLGVSAAVGEAQTSIDEMTQSIDVLQQGTDRIVQRMKTLGEFVGLADQFVQDQGQIVERTQVLALNAALVAARAAEQQNPKQFMVAAREFEAIAAQVSTLAQQTNDGLGSLKQRTNQIHTVVSAIDGEVQNLGGLVTTFTSGVEQSSQVFGEVRSATTQVVQAGESVATSNQEIVNAAQATAEAMRDIAALAERTAQLTQGTQAQSEEMEELSRRLLKSIQFFRLPSVEEQVSRRVDLSQVEIATVDVDSIKTPAATSHFN